MLQLSGLLLVVCLTPPLNYHKVSCICLKLLVEFLFLLRFLLCGGLGFIMPSGAFGMHGIVFSLMSVLFLFLLQSGTFLVASRKQNFFKIGHMKNSQLELVILRRLRISGICRSFPIAFPVIWLRPSPGWVKINCDGAAIGSPGCAAAGSLCRDFTGSAIFSFASPIGVRFAFEAELLAVSLAVDKAFQLKLSPVWIESDSSYVIKLLH